MSRRQSTPTKKDLDAAIRAAGKIKDINEVIRIFQSLGTQADVYTYTAVITAAGNNNCMELAERAFGIALALNQADVVTLNSMITAAGNNNRMDLAEGAYNRAIQTGQADVVTFRNFNEARSKNAPPPGTRFRHNPYSLIRNWEVDNTVYRPDPVLTKLGSVVPRQ